MPLAPEPATAPARPGLLDRLAAVEELDGARIARAIECTRFPYDDEKEIDEEGSLLRAADLIGQLGDPHYLRKANALYHEFEEIGLNKQFGYELPADVFEKYPRFYWNSVFPHIQAGIRYLNVTSRGRQWIAAMYFEPSAIYTFRVHSRSYGTFYLRELRHGSPPLEERNGRSDYYKSQPNWMM
jgi:hypothetical protein